MNNEDFVTHEQAVRLKELGFDWWVNHYYENNELCEGFVDEDEDPDLNSDYPTAYGNYNFGRNSFSAPTLSQVQNWFLEKKKIFIEIYAGDYLNSFGYELKFDWVDNHRYCCQGYRTLRETLSAGIDAAIKYVENYDKEK